MTCSRPSRPLGQGLQPHPSMAHGEPTTRVPAASLEAQDGALELLQSPDGRSFLPLSAEQVATVRQQGGPLWLADGQPVMEVRPGAGFMAWADVAPLVAREGKRC